nr:hypothetical protein [Tanacetum cinerariifolium]
MSPGNHLFTKSRSGLTEAHHHCSPPPPLTTTTTTRPDDHQHHHSTRPPPLDTSRVIQVNGSRSSQPSRKCQQMSHGVTAVTVAGVIVPLHI